MSLWTPNPADVAWWLDASVADSFTLDGSAVAQWRDRSGHDQHVARETNRPSYSANGAGTGYPGVVFDGVDDGLYASEHLINLTHSLFVVFKPAARDPETGGALVSQFNSMGGDAFSAMVVFDEEATPMLQLWSSSQIVLPDIGTDRQLMTSIGSASAWAGYSNGTLIDTGTLSSMTTGTTTVGLGDLGGTPMAFYAGAIAEILLYDSTLGTEERQTVEGYLAWKWGFEESLPAGHPYAEAAPVGPPQFVGTCLDADGAPAARLVRAYLESTGAWVGETTSNATTGAWSIEVVDEAAHTLVASGEPERNALVVSGVMPT